MIHLIQLWFVISQSTYHREVQPVSRASDYLYTSTIGNASIDRYVKCTNVSEVLLLDTQDELDKIDMPVGIYALFVAKAGEIKRRVR